MKISILQPQIIRGDVAHNAKQIQALMDCAQGDLPVLAGSDGAGCRDLIGRGL